LKVEWQAQVIPTTPETTQPLNLSLFWKLAAFKRAQVDFYTIFSLYVLETVIEQTNLSGFFGILHILLIWQIIWET
jgi:hypothetical protein